MNGNLKIKRINNEKFNDLYWNESEKMSKNCMSKNKWFVADDVKF